MIPMYIPLEDCIPKNFYRSSNVFLNGTLIGIHYDPLNFFNI